MSETVIVSDQQLGHAEARAQNSIDEFFGAVRRELVRERDDREIIHSGLGENLELLFARRQKQRRRNRIHDFERVRIEAHEQTRQADFACPVDESP